MLDVDQEVAPRAVVAHEGVQRVALRHPLDEARVGGERHDGVALDAEVEARAARVDGEQRVHLGSGLGLGLGLGLELGLRSGSGLG